MFADYAFNRYIEKGYSPQAAAAIVGAFQQESGADLDPLAEHDEGTGFGIAGWRDPEPGKGRMTGLMDWAKENDLDPKDIDTQLDYFDHEVTDGPEKSVGEALRNAGTVEEAADAMVHYERPEGYDAKDPTKANGYENRVNNARSLLASYTGEDPGAGPSASADAPEMEAYPEDDQADSTDDEVPAAEDDNYDIPDQKTGLQKAGANLVRTSQKLRDQASEPLDYTPGGENVEIDQNYDQGIPVDAYQQYTGMYADGGVVGEASIDDYFKSLGVL